MFSKQSGNPIRSKAASPGGREHSHSSHGSGPPQVRLICPCQLSSHPALCRTCLLSEGFSPLLLCSCSAPWPRIHCNAPSLCDTLHLISLSPRFPPGEPPDLRRSKPLSATRGPAVLSLPSFPVLPAMPLTQYCMANSNSSMKNGRPSPLKKRPRH